MLLLPPSYSDSLMTPESASTSPETTEADADSAVVERWLNEGTLPATSDYFQTDGPTVQYIEAPLSTGANFTSDAPATPALMAASGTTYGPCTLTPEYLHLRASGNYGTIGYKTRTTCSVIVESIRHDTDLRYKSAIWWLKAGSTTSSSNRQQRTLYQQNVAFPCKNKNSTVWAGTTVGTIVHQGKTYYARVYPPTKTDNCGV